LSDQIRKLSGHFRKLSGHHCNAHILRTSNDSYVRFTSIKLAYDFCVKSDKKKTSYEFQWIPFTINTSTINDQIFNTFFSFKHRIPKTIKKQDPSHNLMKILKHIKEVYACGDEKLYQYIVKWFALKFQYTNKKIGTSLVLKSDLE